VVAASRGRAGGRPCTLRSQRLASVHRDIAPMGARGDRCRPPAAVGAGRVRHRHRILFCRRSRAGAVRDRHRGGGALRGGVAVAASEILCRGGDDRGGRGRLRHRDLENREDRAWRAGAANVFGDAVRLRRNARHPRAHRPLRAAGRHHGEPPRTNQAGARATVGRRAPRPPSAASSS